MVIKRLEYGFGTLYIYQPKPPSTSWWFYQQTAEVGNKDQGVEVSGYQVSNIKPLLISMYCNDVTCMSPEQRLITEEHIRSTTYTNLFFYFILQYFSDKSL